MRLPRLIIPTIATLLLGLGLAACPDDNSGSADCDGDFCPADSPILTLAPNQSVIEIVDVGLAVGEPATREIIVRNIGDGALRVDSITLSYEVPEGADDEGIAAFELLPLTATLPAAVFAIEGDQNPKGVAATVRYTKRNDAIPRTAVLTVNAPNAVTEKTQTITFTTNAGVPRLSTLPLDVDFGLVSRSDVVVSNTLTLVNQGSRVLNIGGFQIADDARFGVRSTAYGFDISGEEGFAGVDLAEAIEVLPGGTTTVEVTYLPSSAAPAEGRLLIFSDDPSTGTGGYAVPLVSNKSGPCVAVSPRLVAFGGKQIGSQATLQFEICSCGTEPVEIKNVAIKPGSSPDFTLSYDRLPEGYEAGISPEKTLLIPINECAEVDVTFVPDAVNPRDADNVPIPDEGTVTVASNAFESEVEVALEGAGAVAECPTAVIRVEEGEEVIPQTVLHLDGTGSFASFGEISTYIWNPLQWPGEDDEPARPRPQFVPSATDPQPVVQVNEVGIYRFELLVQDELGNRSGSAECPNGEVTILVQPDQAIHVELTWVTPGDADETDTGDGVGSDLDLHFAHEDARGPDLDDDGLPDPWFDKKWDSFWYNTNPTWGNLGSDLDDPSLDLDDTDGAGPENLNLSVPQDGVTYKIGVHYWNDRNFFPTDPTNESFGPANATVKVFHFADLVYEVTYDNMDRYDMWCVGAIDWPAPVVRRCADEGMPEAITPNYINIFFTPQP